MKKTALNYFTEICNDIERDGLKKNEKIITTPQGAKVGLSDGRDVINMCANNYLGLSDNQELIDAAKKSGVSPYHLASRALQEVGASGTSGSVNGSSGYYNYYNISGANIIFF